MLLYMISAMQQCFFHSFIHSLDRDWISMHFGNLRTTSSNKAQSLFLKILAEQRNLFSKKRGFVGGGRETWPNKLYCVFILWVENGRTITYKWLYLTVDKTIYAVVSSLVLLIRPLSSFLPLSVVLSPALTLQASCPIHPQPTALL